MIRTSFTLLFTCLLLGLARGDDPSDPYDDPHCDGKTVIVHLFEWKWTDIAAECERFLGPAGFCGVQTSPAHEHIIAEENNGNVWWDRYQVVSYKAHSRSGTEEEFQDMVNRCNAVGVRIYVDVVLNHMTGAERSGLGYSGTEFSGTTVDYPAVPFRPEHFTPRDECPSGSGSVDDYSNPKIVRDCRLLSLVDMYGQLPYVQQKQAEFLNRLLSYGVAGFRVDAAKHMWPADMNGILDKVGTLSTAKGFRAGLKPFVYNEVIDRNDGAVTVNEYYDFGLVTEFRYSQKISEAFNNNDLGVLWGLYDPGWGMADPHQAFVFVDNHDNQRGHGGGGGILTHKSPEKYKHSQVYSLAQDYGFTRLMSSYNFSNSDQGPPLDENGNTKDVIINPDGSCGNSWICEHRWNAISRMVGWRNAVAGTEKQHYDNSGGECGFARGNVGFFAMTLRGSLDKEYQTNMPPGEYCNMIDGCATKATVRSDGKVQAVIRNTDEPYLAICVGCTADGFPTPDPTATTPTYSTVTTTTDSTTTGWTTTTTEGTTTTKGPSSPPITEGIHRTVIFVHAETQDGQDVFARGGISHSAKPDLCTSSEASTSPCAISIGINSLGESSHYSKYNDWRVGDDRLDWYGAQPGQGTHNGQQAEGTPMAWTSNESGSPGYQELNTFGNHFWMVDVEMDCSESYEGWFELKSFGTSGIGWEGDLVQVRCQGTAGDQTAPYTAGNHLGMCGYVNVFYFNNGGCIINTFGN